jgi:hypothetical protein
MSFASAIASAVVSTPARLRPVSHSTTTLRVRPESSAAARQAGDDVGLSAATVTVARSMTFASRAILSSPMRL